MAFIKWNLKLNVAEIRARELCELSLDPDWLKVYHPVKSMQTEKAKPCQIAISTDWLF